MRGYDARFLDTLKSKNDLVEVVSRYVHLEQKGNSFWGRCPFHHEKTASFCVNSTDQFYYCFGCHKGGDVISFIMEVEALDFYDAIKFLAERVKMELPSDNYDSQKMAEEKEKKNRILSLLKDTALFYVRNLKSEKATKHIEYIAKRGLNSDMVASFGIGASLDFNSLPEYLKQKGYTEKEMLLSGAVDEKNGRLYDSLGGRLIIPIINQFNQVIAFGGRLLEKADFAKYKNTKETMVFNKSQTLYNINNLKKLKNEEGINSIIIVEGYMDTISLVSKGFRNVVASMGTSLTKDQARMIKRYTTNVNISYDGDFAGQKAAIRGLEILKDEGLEVKVVALPDGLDPDDVVNKYGREGYQKLVDEAKPLIDFKLDILEKTFDINSTEGKRKYIQGALKVIKESQSNSEQEELLKRLRDKTGITYESLKRELESIENGKPKVERVETVELKEKNYEAERFLLSSVIFSKPFLKEFDLKDLAFENPLHIEIKEYLEKEIEKGEKVKPNLLYDVFDDQALKEELSKILSFELEDKKNFDEERYFYDCIRTLKRRQRDSEIKRLTKMFESETDLVKRQKIAEELKLKLKDKNK
ncbi:MAG: DNA primase [Clostridiales bacterium]|nr:DNA primase [Clostridiales bacterium]